MLRARGRVGMSTSVRKMQGFVIVAVLAALLPGCAQSEEPPPFTLPSSPLEDVDGLRGRVDRVYDGDSFVMRSNGKRINVRVFGIDAPEKGQPFSKKARSRSKKLLEGQTIVVQVTTAQDVHGRVVGNVILPDGQSYAHVVVGEGLAWQFRRYSDDPEVAALEAEAKRERRGLWYDKNPEPPWEYRRRKPRR